MLIGMGLILFFYNYEKDMKSFYDDKELELNFEGKKKLTDQKQLFMEEIIRAAQYSNYEINKDRSILKKINLAFNKSSTLTKYQIIKIEKILKKYDLKKEYDHSDPSEIALIIDELMLKVQKVPVRLALAQAIIESAWGVSRFAKEGNAYFGIHCYEDGCGMKFGKEGEKVYVKTYDNMQSSVIDYMSFLNTKRGPKNFRIARNQYYSSSEKNIKLLAQSLDSYSEIGGEYQKIIYSLFKNYIPDEIADY